MLTNVANILLARIQSSPSKSIASCAPYGINSIHRVHCRLYKTVYPSGLDNYATPAASKAPSPSPSIRSDTSSTHTAKQRSGFFSRFSAAPISRHANPVSSTPEGPIEELIMSGTAFGELFQRTVLIGANMYARLWVSQSYKS